MTYYQLHPDRYGRSAKSFAAHLTGLCTWLDDGGGAPSVNASVQRWLSGPSPIVKPTLRYGEALRRWARSTWDAYAPLQATARNWIAASLARS